MSHKMTTNDNLTTSNNKYPLTAQEARVALAEGKIVEEKIFTGGIRQWHWPEDSQVFTSTDGKLWEEALGFLLDRGDYRIVPPEPKRLTFEECEELLSDNRFLVIRSPLGAVQTPGLGGSKTNALLSVKVALDLGYPVYESDWVEEGA